MIPRTLIVVSFLMVLAVGVFDQREACATPSGACSPEFATVLEAQATMQGMREVEMASKLILKPDSVLEYSCFHARATDVGHADMFSDAVAHELLFNFPVDSYSPGGPYPDFLPEINEDRVTAPNNNGGWRLQPGPDPPGDDYTASSLDDAIFELILFSLTAFLNENFGHVYAGGFFADSTLGICNAMPAVWEYLKCQNFDRNDFRSFFELSLLDPRIVPSYMQLTCNDPNRATNWNAAINAANIVADTQAYALPDNYSASDTVEPTPIRQGPDTLDTFVEEIRPTSGCGASVEMVQTGIRVYQGVPPEDVHDDAVCVVPGCYYDGSACVR